MKLLAQGIQNVELELKNMNTCLQVKGQGQMPKTPNYFERYRSSYSDQARQFPASSF